MIHSRKLVGFPSGCELMMEFIFGILVWNLLTLLVFIGSGEDEMLTVKVGCGLLFYLALGFCWVIRKVKGWLL